MGLLQQQKFETCRDGGKKTHNKVGEHMSKKDEKLLTPSEICDRVGISKNTLLRWERDGKIPKAEKDWRGWRGYTDRQLKAILDHKEALKKKNQ